MTAKPENLRISVALGTHQGERFIGEQIESILQQTRPVDEIVLSDDASTDRTVEIVELAVAAARANGECAPDLVVLRNDPPLRVTQNFSQAIAHTTGDLVALCDQDDVWHPERIARLSAALEVQGALLVMSNARQVDAQGAALGHSLFEALAMSETEHHMVCTGQAYTQFMRRNLATGATVMFRRELASIASPFPDSWLHDEWLAMVAAARDGVVVCDEQLTDYRQHDSNQVGMVKLGLRRKLRMFAEPRTERNLRLFRRAAVLPALLGEIPGVPAPYLAMAAEKLEFETARQAYPASRVLRIAPVFRQWRAGRYARYGTGVKDAVRNILQPV